MHKVYYLAFSTTTFKYMLYSAPPRRLFLVHAAVDTLLYEAKGQSCNYGCMRIYIDKIMLNTYVYGCTEILQCQQNCQRLP